MQITLSPNWRSGLKANILSCKLANPIEASQSLLGKKAAARGLVTAGKRPFLRYIFRGRRLLSSYFAKEYALLMVVIGLLW